MKGRMLKRKDRFLFSSYSTGTIRYDITKLSDTKLLGKKLGIEFLNSFKNNIPVKGMYVFGRIGMGKTVLATELIRNFENTDDLLIDVKHKVQYRYYDTYPKCYHLDYFYFLQDDFQWKNKIELKDDEMIIAEWSDYLPRSPKDPIDYFEEDRIEVELYYCFDKKNICKEHWTNALNFTTITNDDSMRFASFIGYGKGINFIESLKQDQELNSLIVDPKDLN